MPDSPFVATSTPDYTTIAKSDPQIISGARWFWWIAGLSLINTIVAHTGGNLSFVMGLGFTLVADGMFQNHQAIAFIIDAVFLAFFFGMGWFAAKGRVWAFVLGIVAYVLDSGIYLLTQDWMPVAFHALALFYIIRATFRLRAAIKTAAESPIAAPPPLTPIS